MATDLTLKSVTAYSSITSVIRLVEVPSNCRISSVELFSGAQKGEPWQACVYMTARATRLEENKVYAIESYRA